MLTIYCVFLDKALNIWYFLKRFFKWGLLKNRSKIGPIKTKRHSKKRSFTGEKKNKKDKVFSTRLDKSSNGKNKATIGKERK
jgi:hypothetical protein